MLEIGARVRFRHPPVRSAVYRSASLQDRRDVHAALAQVTDPENDPDRQHGIAPHATVGPDEDVASELERSAAGHKPAVVLPRQQPSLKRLSV